MPIEIQIEKQYGKHLPPREVIAKSRAWATEQIERQKKDFKRLGVLGAWDRPVHDDELPHRGQRDPRTGEDHGQGLRLPRAQAGQLVFRLRLGAGRGRGRVPGQGRPRGRRGFSVCATTSAASSPRPSGSRRCRTSRSPRRSGPRRRGRSRPTRRSICIPSSATTWSIPSAGCWCWRASARRRASPAGASPARRWRQARGEALGLIRFRHPFYDRDAPVYLGDYVTLDTGTGIVHSSPAYGVEDFLSCKAHGMTDDEILNPVRVTGSTPTALPLFGGMKIWDANPKIVDVMREHGALLKVEKFTHSYMHCWRHRTPVIYRATSQWFAGMDTLPKTGGQNAARTRAGRDRGDAVLSGLGQGSAARHDRQPAGLDAVAPAPVGHADGVLRAQGHRRAAPAHAGTARAGRAARRAGAASRPGRTSIRANCSATMPSTT